MNSYSAIIIDDEKPAQDIMEILLKDISNIQIVGKYTSFEDAYNDLGHIFPEIAFLDVELNDDNGIDVAKRLKIINEKIEIVFASAYGHYREKAREINAFDYLLKPIRKETLKETIDRLLKKIDNRIYAK